MIARPPSNPITLAVNGWLFDAVFSWFQGKYLPVYSVTITSAYRTKGTNEKAGGAEDSAHLYNLAKDITLKNQATGEAITGEALGRVYTDFIKGNWPGFSALYDGHIHLNLDREVSQYTALIGAGALALGAVWGLKKILNQKTKG